MIFSVSSQAYIFLYTVVCGMAIALVYDIFRILRKAVKTGSFATYIQDLLYWLIAAVIMLFTVYYSNDGELRVFLFVGAFLGVVLYSLLLSGIVMGSALLIIKITVSAVKTILRVISCPFKMALRMLAIPARKLSRNAIKLLKKARSSSRVRLSKFMSFKKILKHIRVKI